jgi:hypothetical protein
MVFFETIQRFGAGGRIIGVEDYEPSSSYLFVAGEISVVVYSLGVWQFMVSRRSGAEKLSKGYIVFIWGGMFAAQILFALWVASRTRLVTVIVIATLAYHYGYRRIRARRTLAAALIVLVFVMPIIAWQRELPEGRSDVGSVSTMLRWGWDSIMKRNSSLEGFTVTFESLESAPHPDPLWQVLSSGLIPRSLWANKPFSTWADRFSEWSTGLPSSAFFPSLPGEMLLHFGYIGALLSMMVLGILWRMTFIFFIDSKRPTLGFIYVVLFSQAVSQIEVGFVVPYGALLRNAVICILLFFFVSRSSPKGLRKRSSQVYLSGTPVTGAFPQSHA